MSLTIDDFLSQATSTNELPVTSTLEAAEVKKPIPIYLWYTVPSSKKDAESKTHLVIYTHGSGGDCTSSSSKQLCEGIARSSQDDSPTFAVLGFDGPMHLGTRVKAFTAVLEWATKSDKVESISLAGRSMGCRAAAMTLAMNLENPKLCRKLVLQSYPLVGGGKGTKDEERRQVLINLPNNATIMFQSGSNDEMCDLEDLRELCSSSISAQSNIVELEGADHGTQLAPGIAGRGQKAQANEGISQLAAKVAAEWLAGLSRSGLCQGTIRWLHNDEGGNAEWTGLQALPMTGVTRKGKTEQAPKNREPEKRTTEKPSSPKRKRKTSDTAGETATPRRSKRKTS